MAFKLRSPLHTENPKFGEVPIASGNKSFGGYQSKLKSQMMSTKNPADSGVGTYPDPQTGKRTYYDKKHQSYSEKTGMVNKTGSFKDGKYIMNKPKPAAKPKSPYPANQGGSPLDYRGDGKFNSDKTNIRGADLLGQGPVAKGFRAITGIDVPKSSFPSKKTSTTGSSTGSKGGLAGGGKGEPMQEQNKPASSVSNTNTKTNTKTNTGTGTSKFEGMAPVAKPKNTNPKKTNTSTNTSTSNTTNNTKPIKSSDSDKGTGYFNDKLSFGVDTKLNVAPMPKFERTVTNARSADYDLVKAKGRGKISKLKSRLDRRQGKVENRVEKSLNRIDARQQRQGTKYAGKMKAAQIKSDKGKTDPGYFDSQKKLDAFEKSMDSPKAKSRTSGAGNISSGSKIPSLRTLKSNQTVAEPSIKLKPTMKGKTGFIDDSKIKKGAKKAKDGRVNEPVSAETYKSLTGLNKLTKKAGPSGGMERGMPKSSTSITKPASGPRAKTVKVESGPSERQKAIMNVYNNIRK